MMSMSPASLAASSAPRATVVKNGLVMSVTIRAIVSVFLERRLRATEFGT